MCKNFFQDLMLVINAILPFQKVYLSLQFIIDLFKIVCLSKHAINILYIYLSDYNNTDILFLGYDLFTYVRPKT